MSTPHSENRRYLLRLWIPALAGSALVATLVLAGLRSRDVYRILPVLVAVLLAVIVIFAARWRQKRRIILMLRSSDPDRFLRSFAATLRRMPHGPMLAAANSATVLALYGRHSDAEAALAAVSWTGLPPLIHAQESAARAVIAYARGAVSEGIDQAVVASQRSSIDNAAPGARTSELAYRTYRNLGLALAGRATETTADELRVAFAELPLLGKLLAAWGLAALAKRTGDESRLAELQDFIRANAPHFAPVIE